MRHISEQKLIAEHWVLTWDFHGVEHATSANAEYHTYPAKSAYRQQRQGIKDQV